MFVVVIIINIVDVIVLLYFILNEVNVFLYIYVVISFVVFEGLFFVIM